MKWSCRTFIPFFLSIILSSCGGGNSKISTSFNANAILAEEHPISTEERNIATRICFAYQSKSMKFRTADFLGSRFVFSTKKTDCGNNETDVQLTTYLNYDSNNDLAYITQSTVNTDLFMSKVQTDTSGYLSQLCTKIKNGQEVSNTTMIGGMKVQISFAREAIDEFILQYFTDQGNNTYKITSAEKFKVRTQMDYLNGQILGMDEYYSTQKICGSSLDKNQFSNFEQSFISR